jgi:hypothetical protein
MPAEDYIAPAALAAPSYFSVDRTFYPYSPSLIKWEKTRAGFTEPEVCHGIRYEEEIITESSQTP